MKIIILFLTIIIFFISIIISNQTKDAFVEKINFNFTNDEIFITFIYKEFEKEDLNSILITSKDHSVLLMLSYNTNYLKELLKKFIIYNINILFIDNIRDVDINYKDKILLSNYYYLDKVKYTLNGNVIEIQNKDTNFCIYINRVIDNSDISTCNFIYFYDTINANKLNINNNTNVIFYHSKNPIPTRFLDEIYGNWIDVHAVSDNEFMIIKLYNNDYQLIVVPNIL